MRARLDGIHCLTLSTAAGFADPIGGGTSVAGGSHASLKVITHPSARAPPRTSHPTGTAPQEFPLLRLPIEPMRAVGVPGLPGPRDCRGGCVYQSKFDGWRSLAFRRADGTVYLQSRHSPDLTPYFPDIAAAVADALPAETVVDGGLIVWHEPSGRASFPALQERITAGRRLPAVIRAQPACLVVFDVLEVAGELITGAPLAERRALLEKLVADSPATLPVCPQTGEIEQARQWFDDLTVIGCEGIVAKDQADRYRAGRPGSWWKVNSVGETVRPAGDNRRSEMAGTAIAVRYMCSGPRGHAVPMR
jgi:hypothetical protein